MIDLVDYLLCEQFKIHDDMFNHLCIDFDNINEALGMPDGLMEDARYISSEISRVSKQYKKTKFSFNVKLSKLQMRIFDTLTIEVSYKNEGSPEGAVKFKDNKFSRNFVLQFTLPYKRVDDIVPEIAHELLHCYTYIKRGENSDKESNFLNRQNLVNYNKLFSDKNKSIEELIVTRLVYTTYEDEIEAFIVEITADIESKIKEIKNSHDAYKVLYSNDVYKFHISAPSLLNNYKTNIPKICEIYREYVTSDKTLTDKEIIRKLKRRFKYIKKRLESIVPRIMTRYKDVEITLDGGNMRSFMRKINERMNALERLHKFKNALEKQSELN